MIKESILQDLTILSCMTLTSEHPISDQEQSKDVPFTTLFQHYTGSPT